MIAFSSDVLGEDLRDRLDRSCREARRLLGQSSSDGDPGAPGQLPGLIANLTEITERRAGGERAAIGTAHEAALGRLRDRFEARFEALARAHAAVARLRGVTSPSTMLARAPAALCDASTLERAILSLVSGDQMVAEAAHFGGDPARAQRVLAELRADPIRLEHPLIETELLRRRRATLVAGARVHPRVDARLSRLMDWEGYVAAPLVVGAQVIGVMHADRDRHGPPDVLDREVLWEFASGLAQAYESASLIRTLRHEREQMRQFLDWLNARSSELTDAPIRLATLQRPPSLPGSAHGPEGVRGSPEPTLPLGRRDDRVIFDGILTRRQLDVLRLLAHGNANRAIGQALVISDGTVKFHVNAILRRLGVANRAQAASRYLRLLGIGAP